MKKWIAAMLALALLSAVALAEVSIDETNFPDAAFREAVAEFDADGDGAFSDDELAKVKQIECGGKGIQSVKGLEFFTALESLGVHDNELTELDVSNNPLLTFIDAPGNKLTALDVSNNPALTDLYVQNNGIASLDVSACPKLAELVEKIERVTRVFDFGTMDCFEGDDIGCWMFVDAATVVTARDTVSEKSVKTIEE